MEFLRLELGLPPKTILTTALDEITRSQEEATAAAEAHRQELEEQRGVVEDYADA